MSFQNRMMIIASILSCLLAEFAFPQVMSTGTVDLSFQPANATTQMAIWAEDNEGAYLGTIFVTDFIGRRGGGNRTADTNIDSDDGNRLSALPIWSHRRNTIDRTYGIDNFYPPAQNKSAYPADIDAVSEATPDNILQTISWPVNALPAGTYHFFLEANMSFDTNEYHQYSFYRGQPSVIWECVLYIGSESDMSQILDYFGYGSPDGSDGNVRSADGTITTAAELLVNRNGVRFQAVYTPSETGVEETSKTSPASMQLFQNYPNPFNPETEISYDLDAPSHVRIIVQNLTGQEVATLVNEDQQPGGHRVRFDGRNLSSGIYFYRINIGEKAVQSRKMILLR